MLSKKEKEYRIIETIRQFNGEMHEDGILRFYNEHVIEGTEEEMSEEEFSFIIADLFADNVLDYNSLGCLEVVTNIYSI